MKDAKLALETSDLWDALDKQCNRLDRHLGQRLICVYLDDPCIPSSDTLQNIQGSLRFETENDNGDLDGYSSTFLGVHVVYGV